jgi:ribonucleoside-diphosphate reductase alpha chain
MPSKKQFPDDSIASITELDNAQLNQYRVIRRNGQLTEFDANKIATAMTKAFLAVEGDTAIASNRITDAVETLTEQVIKGLSRRLHDEGKVHIEDIQDQVELALMRAEYHKVARAYVLYREEHALLRSEKHEKTIIYVTDLSGQRRPLDEDHLRVVIADACTDLENVNPQIIWEESLKNFFDGISERDVNHVLVMTTRTLIEKEPNYTYVAARLLLNQLRKEALGFIKFEPDNATAQEMGRYYSDYFKAYVQSGIEQELLDSTLADFDLDKLGNAIEAQRDLQLTFLGLQTLYDRYFLHSENIRFELPQAFFMRVAMGIALNENDREARAIEFYHLLSRFDFMSSTPTLFNSGTLRSQMSSCYLTTVPDDLEGIFDAIKDNAMLSKFAGGLGNDWTPVRGMGSHIKGTNGKSQGVVPFLKVANDVLVAVNQGGRRRGSGCAYLETWHIDIEEFLELRKNTGDERRRTHDMNTAAWIPDLFLERVHENEQWTLFSPNEVPDLHDLYGKAFKELYQKYEAAAFDGQIKIFKRVSAVALWRKMLTMLFETAHPWLTFKDACNLRSPQQHQGVVHSSNLCCIAADQRVVTDRGILTVGELYQQGGKNQVVGLDRIENASEMLLPRPNAPMVQIQTLEGYTHKVTPDHKVWLKDKGWVEAQHLVKGDQLLIQQREGLWGPKHRPEWGYLIGFMTGISLNPMETNKNSYDYSHLIEHVTPSQHHILEGNTVKTLTHTNWNFSEQRPTPLHFLEQLGLTSKTRVPQLVWQGSRETVAEYFRGLYQVQRNGALVLRTVHLNWLQELQILWANFGIKTCLNIQPQLKTLGQYQLSFSSIPNRQRAENIMQLGTQAVSEKPGDKTQDCPQPYATFTKLIRLPNEDAYCLTVDSDTHAWTVNSLITKNTEITLNTKAGEEVAVCFPKGTWILTRNGQKPIEACDNEQVLIPLTESLQPQHKYLPAKLIPQGTQMVYQLVTKNGIVIEATAEHPFLVQAPFVRNKPADYQWKKLQELQEGDFIVCPFTAPVYDDLGIQDADWTAAGWMNGRMTESYCASFGPNETAAKEFVLPILNRWHQQSEPKNPMEKPTTWVQPNGMMNWQTQCPEFIDYVANRFGLVRMSNSEKSLSETIKMAEPNKISSFLSGLFSASGQIMIECQNKKKVTICLYATSIKLLQDVQLLLKPFGVHGHIRVSDTKRTGDQQHRKGQYDITTPDSIRNFAQFIGFSLSPAKHALLADLKNRFFIKYAFQNSPVVSISPLVEKEVFDLSLTEDHNFLANGLVVHNCNLGSVNLSSHITNGQLDSEKLQSTVSTAMRMLDNVIDINYYSVVQARTANMRHRPVGLGIMGFTDALYQLRIPYASHQAVEFADQAQELVSYYAISASTDLAAERGCYSTFEGSLWSQGILPIDSIQALEQTRGKYLEMSTTTTLDWKTLRERVKKVGMRNSNCMAIAPTATISNICGVTQSIEPTYQNLYVKSNLSGEFTVINPYLIRDLKAYGLWDEVMLNDLKFCDGSIQSIERIPDELKKLYATAFEMEPEWLIEAASRRQKWIDQAQSLNLYMREPSGRKLDELYKLAWLRGLKTTYYLRTMGATRVQKSTVLNSLVNSVTYQSCALNQEEECEVCQ